MPTPIFIADASFRVEELSVDSGVFFIAGFFVFVQEPVRIQRIVRRKTIWLLIFISEKCLIHNRSIASYRR